MSRKAKYTDLDRLAVQLWLAKVALTTARPMLKRPDHRARVDVWLGEIKAFRESLGARDARYR